MAKNDVVLIDSLLQQMQLASPAVDIPTLFERLVLEQVLKNYDLSQEELDFGWTDGAHDGGIDGFYVLVNGRLLTDPSDFSWPRSGAEIDVYLVTCKHHSTFQQVPIDALLASVQEIFDLSRSNSELAGKYSADIKRCRDMFVAAFRNLSIFRPSLRFSVVYASRGDTGLLGESIAARARQLTDLLHAYFSAAAASFAALGAAELVELHRQVKTFALDLPVQECLTAGQEGYVVLARLKDYSAFVQDESGHLRRYLFDSNVRAYLGANLVNDDIAETLAGRGGPNFWWLNNGVTILSTSASLVGKTLKLRDIQIVNGLQTTESIHRHFAKTSPTPDDARSLLVKVIVSQDEGVRDQVIRATNNQSTVEPAALHATDRIQRNIEEILLRHEWYYERRTNYYKNEGRPDVRIISPLTLAAGAVALLLKNPTRSSKLRQKHLRSPEAYAAVYSSHFPLEAWPLVALLIRSAESAIDRAHRAKRVAQGQHLSAWRGPVAYIAAARLAGSFAFQVPESIAAAAPRVNDAFMDECWDAVKRAIGAPGSSKVSRHQMIEIASTLTSRWGIAGSLSDGERSIPGVIEDSIGRKVKRTRSEDEAFIKRVQQQLPAQPWKPGVHVEVATTMEVDPRRVQNAIRILIAKGAVMQQRDGILYDMAGNEVGRDPSRERPS